MACENGRAGVDNEARLTEDGLRLGTGRLVERWGIEARDIGQAANEREGEDEREQQVEAEGQSGAEGSALPS